MKLLEDLGNPMAKKKKKNIRALTLLIMGGREKLHQKSRGIKPSTTLSSYQISEHHTTESINIT